MFEDVYNYIDKQSRFYKFAEGEILTCKILDARVEPGRFGEETHISIIDKKDGEEKTISTKSTRLLRKLFTDYKAQPGDWFAIKRFGESFGTEYAVKKLQTSGDVVPVMKDPQSEKLRRDAQVTRKMFEDKEKRVAESKKEQKESKITEEDLNQIFKDEGRKEK